MRRLRTMAGVGGLLLCSVFCSDTSKAELICIHPVPLTIKELVDKQKAGHISDEVMKLNIDYLTLKYCAAATMENLTAVSSVPLGDGCEMKSGNRLGELVYWTTCNSSADKGVLTVVPDKPGSEIDKKKDPGQEASKRPPLQRCLAFYERRHGRFVPEGQSTPCLSTDGGPNPSCVKSKSDWMAMCNFAIARRNYFFDH
jgi:hypothetical protein